LKTENEGKAVRRLIVPGVFGLAGVAVLLSLGFWQLARLDVKLDQIARIEARIAAPPVPVPAAPDPERDRYLPVTVDGMFTGDAVHVLSSLQGQGAGSRVIAVLQAEDGRRLAVDRGFVPEARRAGLDLSGGPVTVTGNLDWPRDADSYTPPPDLARGLWFSRAAAPIAAHLGTEPLLIVARAVTAPGGDAVAVPGLVLAPTGIDIRNDHLEYAITWFLLALVWAAMSLYLIWRTWRDGSAGGKGNG
jgi:surfeit locus 1 family protein